MSPSASDPIRGFRGLTALAARHMGDLSANDADRFWDLCHSTDVGVDTLDEAWCRIQQALLRRRGPDQLGYLAAVSRYRNERLDLDGSPRRHLCGNRMYRVTVEILPLGGYRRDLCHCERCGFLADMPAGARAPLLVSSDRQLVVQDNPWPTARMTSGVSPVGFSLLAASDPCRVGDGGPLVWPEEHRGRRFGVVLVANGDHLIIQTPIPPFDAAGASHRRPAEQSNSAGSPWWRSTSATALSTTS